MKILVIAQNPPNEGCLLSPMKGTRSLGTLRQWLLDAGIDEDMVKIVNASQYVGKQMKYAVEQQELAKGVHNTELIDDIHDSDFIITLGRFAHIVTTQIFHNTNPNKVKGIYNLPHPSGQNRLLNNSEVRLKVQSSLRDLKNQIDTLQSPKQIGVNV